MINSESVTQTIRGLSAEGNFSVSNLAKTLGVSRQLLYRDFKDLLPDKPGKAHTEECLLDSISILRASLSRDTIKVTELARHAGLSRQTISRYYSHLYPYLKGKPIPARHESRESTLLIQVRQLERQIASLKSQHAQELAELESSTYSVMMQLDLGSFKGIKTKATLDKIQSQNDELAELNRVYLADISELRSRLAGLKDDLKPCSNSTVLGHLRPDYSAISLMARSGARPKDVMRLFLKLEREHLAAAAEVCLETKPDLVLFFQPFFSCSIDACPIVPKSGSCLIVESNLILGRSREEFTGAISSRSLAVYATSHLSPTKFFCRTNKLPFDVQFIETYFDKILVPSIDEGFISVCSFKPTPV